MSDGQDARQVVNAWIGAVNRGDLARAGALVSDEVAIAGPRGTAAGRDAVADWIRHTGIRLGVTAVHGDSDEVTVDGEGTWSVPGGEPGERTPPAPIAMRFQVRDGKIASIRRV